MAPSGRRADADSSPPIPSYDEAIAIFGPASAGSRWRQADAEHERSLDDEDGRRTGDTEAHFLLGDVEEHRDLPFSSSRQTGTQGGASGYAPPTVETDDEDSGWEDELDNALEADQVRREMQDLEIIDMEEEDNNRLRHLPSIWGKRIGGFSLSLPRLRFRWKGWRLPRLRGTIRLGEQDTNAFLPSNGADENSSDGQRTGSSPPRRRCCVVPTIATRTAAGLVCRGVLIFVTLALVYLFFMSDLFTSVARRVGGRLYDPESVRLHVQSSVDGQLIAERLRHLSGYAHLAGSEGDFALASDVRKAFHAYGLEDVTVDEFVAYLNYPRDGGRAVEIVDGQGKVEWSAQLEEGDQGEEYGHQTFAFHAHSKSGEASGPLIYANYGTRQDFKRLHDSGIITQGAVALVRQGGQQPNVALKVRAAEVVGFAGCLVYTDPADNGFARGPTLPDGRYLPADGVQRGSVSLANMVMGDPLTPGWESKQGMPRLQPNKSAALPGIPSLPLAWRDAQMLLQRLEGHGEALPQDWVGGVPEIGDTWWSGDQSSPTVHLRNEQDELEAQPVWNVYAKIAGVEQTAKKVIVGNRRDALGFGASAPHSGTAVMLETARILGDLLAKGWRPMRSIEFMSWDGGAYNLIGSTEYVERTTESLRADGMAYINLDGAVTGTEFHASGSPMFKRLLLQLMNRINAPMYNASLRDVWDRRQGDIEGMLDANSDYAPFLNIAGMSSLDIHFSGDAYPLDSNYDTYKYIESVADPSFEIHTALGQLLALLTVELADRPVLPFDIATYADDIGRWVEELDEWAAGQGVPATAPLDLGILKTAAGTLREAVQRFAAWEEEWERDVLAVGGYEPMGLGNRRFDFNNHLARFETDLLDLADDGGIVNRTQFKHVVLGPTLWPQPGGPGGEPSAAYFPGIRDLVEGGDWAAAQTAVAKTARVLEQAGENLLGFFS